MIFSKFSFIVPPNAGMSAIRFLNNKRYWRADTDVNLDQPI